MQLTELERPISDVVPHIFKRPVLTVGPSDSLLEAGTFLAIGPQIYVDGLVVLDGQKPVGRMGGQHIIQYILQHQDGWFQSTASQIMSHPPFVVKATDPLSAALDIFSKTRFAFVPITINGRVATSLSMRDVLRLVAGKLNTQVGELSSRLVSVKGSTSIKNTLELMLEKSIRNLAVKDEGNIRIYVREDGWFWFIPLADDLTSVGAVVHARTAREWTGTIDELYTDMLRRSKRMPIHWPTTLVEGDVRRTCTIVDLSRSGARVKLLEPLARNSRIRIGVRGLVFPGDSLQLEHLEMICMRELQTHHHIRELRTMRAKLADYEQRHEKLMGAMGDAVVRVQEGIVTSANAAFAQLVGQKTPDPLVGNPLLDLIAPENQAQIKQFLKFFTQGKAKPEQKLPLVLARASNFSTLERAAVSAAEASAVQADANRDQAKRALERTLELKAQNPNLISPEQLEQAQTAHDVAAALATAARHQVEQTRAAFQEARDQLAKTHITAPMSGRVTRLAVEEGEVAVPGTFSRETGLLLTVADLSVIMTTVQVDETDVVRLHLGDSVEVSIDAFPDTSFTGRVTEVSNSAILTGAAAAAGAQTDRAVDYEVEITLDRPPTDVRPDLSATARIITDTRDSSLAIPIIALTVREHAPIATELKPADTTAAKGKKKEAEGVFVVHHGKATFRPVRVGIPGDEYFEVLDGVAAGDTIVAGPYQAIRDLKEGAAVRPSRAQADSARRRSS